MKLAPYDMETASVAKAPRGPTGLLDPIGHTPLIRLDKIDSGALGGPGNRDPTERPEFSSTPPGSVIKIVPALRNNDP